MPPLPQKTVSAIRRSGVQHVIATVLEEQSGASEDSLRYTEGPRTQVEHLLTQTRTKLAFAGSADPRIADLVRTRHALAEQTLADHTGTGFAAEADIAALAAGAVLRSGHHVPDDLAVVGHDDSPLASLFVPGLTSVRVDTAGLGRYLAQLALSAATDAPKPEAGPETEAQLVVRESSGRAN